MSNCPHKLQWLRFRKDSTILFCTNCGEKWLPKTPKLVAKTFNRDSVNLFQTPKEAEEKNPYKRRAAKSKAFTPEQIEKRYRELKAAFCPEEPEAEECHADIIGTQLVRCGCSKCEFKRSKMEECSTRPPDRKDEEAVGPTRERINRWYTEESRCRCGAKGLHACKKPDSPSQEYLNLEAIDSLQKAVIKLQKRSLDSYSKSDIDQMMGEMDDRVEKIEGFLNL